MDPQDKKSKDWSLFGKAEDRAIAKAKYKREMGINPSYKTEQNAEVSRSAQSMKNPTSRPYDVKTSPKGLKKPESPKAAEAVSWDETYRSMKHPFVLPRETTSTATPKQRKKLDEMYRSQKARVSESSKFDSLRKARAALKKGSGSGESSDAAPPKPRPKPELKAAGAATDKSRLAPKTTNFQRQKARQFEKEGVAGRSMTAAQAKRKASEKGSSVAGLRSLFGLSKTKSAPDKKSLSSEFRKKNLAANQKIGKKQ